MTIDITSPISSSQIFDTGVVNRNQQIFNDIKSSSDKKEQLKKVANEFESIFVTKMMSIMDKTIEKEGGVFGEESKYVDTFKSHVFQELGRQFANGSNTTIGFASTIYKQMEKYVE